MPSGYGQWPPPDYYSNGSSRRRKGGLGRKLVKLFLFLVLIGAAVGGGWYGMQLLSGSQGKESVAKKKKRATAEATEETKQEDTKVEAKIEPKKEETKKEETKKEEPKIETKKEEPKKEPKIDPKKEDMPKVDGPLVYFDKHILPIMQRHCIKCHGEGNKKFEGKFDARTVAAIIKGGENGKSVVLGNPEKSLLWEDNIKIGAMPPRTEGKLSDDEKKLIYDWIKGGCKETAAVAAN